MAPSYPSEGSNVGWGVFVVRLVIVNMVVTRRVMVMVRMSVTVRLRNRLMVKAATSVYLERWY